MPISPKKFQNRVVTIAGFAGFSRFAGKVPFFAFAEKTEKQYRFLL